jgi:hypothetical protein
MREQYTFENEYWTFFGYGEGWPPNKCRDCYQLLDKLKEPNEHCINCWKLEIFFSNCTDIDAVKDYFLEEGKKDNTLHGKWLKAKMRLPRDLLTSMPVNAHPDEDVKEDSVILIYCQSIEEREMRRKKILKDLKALGLYKKDDISYRRGCLNFDEVIGNWKGWYDIDKDYGDLSQGGS